MNIKGNRIQKFLGVALILVGLVQVYKFSTAQEDVTGQATPADQAVAKELFSRARNYPESQSFSQLRVPFVQSKVLELSGLARHEQIINLALAKEVEMANQGYAVFYTAVPYMRMFQDISRKMYKAVVGKVGALGEKAFQFIRYAYQDPTYMQYNNVTDFLLTEIAKEGIIDDNLIRLKTILVSTNLAFFGNAGFTGESTYFYFNNPQPWASANPEWLRAALVSFGYSTNYVDELMSLVPDIVTKTGDIFQIFITTSKVDDIGYLSWRQGIPFDVPFIEDLFGRPDMTFGRSDRIYAAEINNRIAEFKEKYRNGDQGAVNMVNYLLKSVANGDFKLSPFFKLYKTGKLRFTNFYQARLLIGSWFLDPTQGVRIYRYSTLDPEREQAYKRRLKDIFRRMEQERRQRLNIPQITPAEVVETEKESVITISVPELQENITEPIE